MILLVQKPEPADSVLQPYTDAPPPVQIRVEDTCWSAGVVSQRSYKEILPQFSSVSRIPSSHQSYVGTARHEHTGEKHSGSHGGDPQVSEKSKRDFGTEIEEAGSLSQCTWLNVHTS